MQNKSTYGCFPRTYIGAWKKLPTRVTATLCPPVAGHVMALDVHIGVIPELKFHSWFLWLCVWSSFLVSSLFYSLYSCLKYFIAMIIDGAFETAPPVPTWFSSDCDAVIRTLEGAAKALTRNCEGAEDSLLEDPSVVEIWCVLNKLQWTQNIN